MAMIQSGNTIASALASLGLSQYLQPLLNEGFDDWNAFLDITENDMVQIGIKLGHRRKLQLFITQYWGQR